MSEQQPSQKTRRRMPSGLTGILQAGETLRGVARISTAIYWKTIAVFILAVILLLTLFNLGVLMVVVTVITFISAWLTKRYLLLALTDRRVVIRYGVLQLETIQLHYNKIESVELSWTMMGRMLGYATMMITGTGSRVSMIPFVANAVALRAQLDQMLTLQEDRVIKVENVVPPPAPPMAPPPPAA